MSQKVTQLAQIAHSLHIDNCDQDWLSMIEHDYDPAHTCIVLVSSDTDFAVDLRKMLDCGYATVLSPLLHCMHTVHWQNADLNALGCLTFVDRFMSAKLSVCQFFALCVLRCLSDNSCLARCRYQVCAVCDEPRLEVGSCYT